MICGLLALSIQCSAGWLAAASRSDGRGFITLYAWFIAGPIALLGIRLHERRRMAARGGQQRWCPFALAFNMLGLLPLALLCLILFG